MEGHDEHIKQAPMGVFYDVGGCKRDEHEKHARLACFSCSGVVPAARGLVVVVASNGDGGCVSRCRGKAAG